MLSRRNTTEPFDRFPPRLNKAKRKGHDIDTKGIHANNPSSIFASFKRKKIQKVEEKPDDLKAKFIEMDAENKRQMQQVPCVEFGRFEIKTWYPSPYPKAFYPHDKLFVCESCLGYTSTKRLLEHHRADECDLAKKRPPGRKVYDEMLEDSSTLTLIEVDGKTDALYCQNLCLFAKLFMDQKTLYFDVSLFWFYILCVEDKDGVHPVGYFSKEKENPDQYNLSCIVVFPPYQRNGNGSLLISLSYEITKREQTVGTPEKPLSTLGRAAYIEYWRYVLLTQLSKCNSKSVSIQKLSYATGIMACDLLETFKECNGLLAETKVRLPFPLEELMNYLQKNTLVIHEAILQTQLEVLRPLRVCQPRQLKWKPSAKPSR
ncbi:unnamed protein product [Aphanomyces euteiches]